MKVSPLLFVLGSALSVAPSLATATSHEAYDRLAAGEVRKVDYDAKKITIRHGPLPELDMPTPMTMVYRVRDPALLDQVKAGDKIRFAAEKVGGQFTLMRVEAMK